jgi:hypothetical protein
MKYLIRLIFVLIPLSMSAQNIGVKTGTPSTTLDVNGSAAFREGTALTLSNGANNDIALADYSFFRVTGPTAAFTVTGFANGTDGRALTLVNASGQTMTLGNQTASSPTNQIKVGSSSVSLPANGVATMIYNATLSKWIVSGTIGNLPSFSNITTGALTDSLIVTNNGTPFKVRPVDFIETYAWGLDGNVNTNEGTNFVGTMDAQSLVFKTNNTEGMRLTTNQTLGIGTTTPLSNTRLHVENTGTNHAIYAPIGTNYNYFAGKTAFGRATSNPTTTFLGTAADAFIHVQDSITSLNSAVVTEGIGVKLKIVPTAASTGGVYGVNARIHTAAYNAQNIGVIEAGNFDTRHYGTGTLSNGYGAIIRCVNIGTGRINRAVGLGIDIGNYSGITDTIWGILIGGGGFGTMTNANFGIGLHIGDIVATSAYGIWQGGNDDKNYFAGNVGLGTITPLNRLDANGSVVIGNAYAGSTTAPTNGLLVEGNTGIAATLKVGGSASTIDANSLVELESTTKGFVPPRMTTAQMSAITGALVGSIVYNTTLNCLHQKTAGGWLSLCNSATPYLYEATQTTFLTQATNSAFADIPGLSALTITVPRTATYIINVKTYFTTAIATTATSNSGGDGSFKLIVDGTSYEESFLSSVGIYNANGGVNLYGLGSQGTISKVLTLTAGNHTISIQGRTWFLTNCASSSWGTPTSGYANSAGIEAGKCKLTVLEN